jgi:diguanylate cyclase (GGDEF)-like protein/PAS domain S-box-containing protein
MGPHPRPGLRRLTSTDKPRPLQQVVAQWRAGTLRLTQSLAIAFAGLLAAIAGTMALPLSPWSALALSGGVVSAATLRWGAGSGLSAAAGTLIALIALSLPAISTLVAAVALIVGVLAGVRVLQRVAFDARLDRDRDVRWLVFAVCLIAAPVMALVACSGLRWTTPTPSSGWLTTFAAGWATLATGMLLSAFPLLAVDRRLLKALQRRRRLPVTATLVAATLLATALIGSSSVGASATGRLLLFVPPAVLVVLAVRAGAALAACELLIVALVAFASAGPGTLWWGAGMSLYTGVGGWVASMLAVLLVVHAGMVESTWRAQRWQWALDGSRLGVADWHLEHDESFASAAWCALTRHESGRWTPAKWLLQVHADERDLLDRTIARLASGESGRAQIELRMPREGGWRWLEATLLVIERSVAGHPTRLLATLADVEERHEALERQRLSASLFQHLHEGLLVTDADLRVLDVNPAYTQILGFARNELLGSVPSLLRPSLADPLARQQRAAMWASLRDTGRWRGELLERRRSGEPCTLQATISSVQGPNQDLRYHVLVISDITEQRVQRERLERQAHFDELTRLPNRVHLSLLLADAMSAADRDGFLLVVCYLDLDRFKPVNDRFGHAAGDRLLAELAGRLRGALRRRDTWADSAARLGGDEFVLLLRAGTIEEARLAVERVLRVVAQPYLIDVGSDPVQITASMGATVYPIDRSDPDTLLRHADHAMYGAKQSGRNGYLFFDPEHRRRNEERVMAIGRVQEALDQGEFVLFYQPKVDMRSGRVLGFEALLRWEHPQQGLIAPQQFLPLIENTGLSARVGDWVFSQALEHLSQWRRNGMEVSVSVNVSARHLQEPDFAQRLSELLARHSEALAPHLELEILETAAHADIEATSALMTRCRILGVRFALDDFGTGYSTLTYLKQLPVSVLKIDRSFVHHMLDDSQDRAIVEGVIGLARTFDCAVVAEGVESPAQARTLLELGCDIGQGTGIAAPMPAGLVANWVKDYRGMFALVPAPAAGEMRSGTRL